MIILLRIGLISAQLFQIHRWNDMMMSTRNCMIRASSSHNRSNHNNDSSAIQSHSMNLRNHGCMQILIEDQNDQELLNKGFRTAISAMDYLQRNLSFDKNNRYDNSHQPEEFYSFLSASDDSHHANGYHPANISSLSRYNLHREGFVFSDGIINGFEKLDNDLDLAFIQNFTEDMKNMRGVLHKLAGQAWALLEEEVILNRMNTSVSSDDNDKSILLPSKLIHQDTNGSLNVDEMVDFSQWHIKRYHYSSQDENSDHENLLLGLHTDPSLISVVIHDIPGIHNGCRGLRFKSSKKNIEQSTLHKWIEVPKHGHGICTILIGGAFARIVPAGTHGKSESFDNSFQPCLHKVCAESKTEGGDYTPFDSSRDPPRVVATYFLRPSPQTILSPIDGNVLLKSGKVPRSRRPITFHDWCARTSKNYRNSKSN